MQADPIPKLWIFLILLTNAYTQYARNESLMFTSVNVE